MANSIGDFQRRINTLRDKIVRGEASVKEKAIVEYYDHTKGGAPLPTDPFAAKVFSRPFSYSMMKNWVTYRQAEDDAYSSLNRDSEAARRRNIINDKYVRAVKAKKYSGSLEQWKKDFVKNEAAEAYAKTNYNPHLAYTKFQRTDPSWSVQNVNTTWAGKDAPYTRPIVTLDIETDDYNRPITISAIKSAFNKKTGQMEIIDTYERFYRSLDKNLVHTNPTHGLTRNILDKLRKQQGADYSWTYKGWGLNKGREKEALNKFLGNSILVGHNIHDFDLPNLFGKRVKNQVVDTLMAARNIWGDNGNNSLDQVFKRIFKVTMEEAGLPHHDSMSDTIATAMIYEAMATSQTPTGSALRKILRHGNLNLAPVDLNIDADVGGSQLIRGPYWRYALQNVRDYIDKKGLTGDDYMRKNQEDDMTEEDFEGEVLGTAVHIEGPRRKERGDVNPNTAGADDTVLMVGALADSIDRLSGWLQFIKDSAVDIRGFGSSLSQYRKAQYIQLLSRAEYDNEGFNTPGTMRKVAHGLGIPDQDYDNFRVAATALKESKEYTGAFNELRRYTRMGLGDSTFVKSLRASLADTWGDWGPQKLKALERDREYAEEREFRKKDRHLRSALRKGAITEDQYLDLSGLEGSYEDLVDATDEVIKKNQQLMKTYEAFGNIRMYDPNQYLASARNQASGILSSAKGVVPSFILNPLSRLTEAAFNYQQEKLTGFNAASRIWHSGIGNAVTGILGSTMGLPGLGVGMAISGGVNALSQVVGNVGQYRLEKAGFAIQNTLNTLGAAAAWVAAPFKILSKATKGLIGGFSGLSWSLSRLMKGGLGDMAALGNPLTELTGVNYPDYQGTTMMDVASLFNKGSMNSVYEDFAKQQKALYTTGEVNQGRMLAASMLGMFNEVYGQSTDTEGQYNGMVNRLLRRLENESPEMQQQTMYLASQIDSNLPGLLRTARMLGVTDINQLMDPSTRKMYWRPIGDAEAGQFRWDQYEFGAARTQMGVTKMRFADKLWNAIGKDLYNGFNRLADSALTGDWDSAVGEASEMWETFKKKFISVWDGIKGAVGGKDWGSAVVSGFAKIGVAALEVVRLITNAWGQLVGVVLDKMSGLISYLSTISITPHLDVEKGLTFEVSSIKDKMKARDKDRLVESDIWYNDPKTGWKRYLKTKGSYEELAEQLFPGEDIGSLTVGDLRKKLMYLQDTWTDPEGNAGKHLTLNGWELVPDSEKSIDYILKMASLEPGREFDAAAFGAAAEGFRYRKGSYGTTYGDTWRDFTEQMSAEVVDPIIDTLQGKLQDTSQKLELNIKVNDKNVGDVIMEDGKLSKSINMLSNMIHDNLSIQLARVQSSQQG